MTLKGINQTGAQKVKAFTKKKKKQNVNNFRQFSVLFS